MPEIDQHEIRRFEPSGDVGAADGVMAAIDEAPKAVTDPPRFSELATGESLIHAGE